MTDKREADVLDLIDILVCPACRNGLSVPDPRDELLCASCGLAYPIVDDIPVLLVDRARSTREE